MKISISLPEKDVAVLDRFAAEHGLSSRSAAVQQAVRTLTERGLEQEYAIAWDEWEAGGEEAVWDLTSGDGVAGASR
ncbi:antitoxin [Tersicoccus phoenicis]|uniref:Antitoxin n=1 Tax=Tersicoccus phoenicis TaxID=554083 RepID=A0A1R1LKV4_9MICC|nr:ribbon-helix-helix domain-containing protein [Tersicoccus phoenicis]OMH28177.1 antitoxin [Tersicoccus phoenicis]